MSTTTGLEEIQLELEKIKNQFPQKNLLIVANKVDQITVAQQKTLATEIPQIHLLSAKQQSGIDSLKEALLNLVNTGALRNNETIVTNTRHYDALLKALEEVERVQFGMDEGTPGDLLAIDIRQALFHFGEITGEITSDDLLGNIFANFCIGK